MLAAVGLALLALPHLLRSLGRRIDPGRWAGLVAVALVAGLGLFEFAALLAVAPPVLRALGLPQLAGACEQLLGVGGNGGTALALGAGVVGAAVALTAAAAAGAARRTARRVRVAPGVGVQRSLPGGAVLVVLPGSRPVAVSVPVPGAPGQMLLSQGLVDRLDPDGLDAVCAHEAAHLRLRHSRHLALAMAIEGAFRWWPLARKSADVLRVALERWADEEAAGNDPAARTTLRKALICVALGPDTPTLAAFAGLGGLLERLDALDRRRAPVSPLHWTGLLVPGLSLAVVAWLCVGLWAPSVHCVAGLAGQCLHG